MQTEWSIQEQSKSGPQSDLSASVHRFHGRVINRNVFEKRITLKCLSIGTPKSINFPFVPNGKLMDFRCPNIQAHHNYAVICLYCGTPKNDYFSIWDKWKINYFRCPNT